MAYVMGAVTPGTPSNNGVVLNWGAASGGTGPYSYKIYRSTTSGFTPGAGNLVGTVGVGILTFTDSGLFPNTQYYYVVQSVDTGNANATANATQVSVLTAPYQLPMNAYAMSPYIGMLDESYNYNTKPVIIDPSLALTTQLFSGQAVKRTQPQSLPSTNFVTPCTAATDPVWGFLCYSYKDPFWAAGMTAAVAQEGDVIWLFCTVTGDITTQPYCELDLATVGGVKPGVGSDGNVVVGEFIDPPVAGTLVRVQVKVPNKSLVF